MITIYVYTFCIICYNSSKKFNFFYIPFCFKMPLAVLWAVKARNFSRELLKMQRQVCG